MENVIIFPETMIIRRGKKRINEGAFMQQYCTPVLSIIFEPLSGGASRIQSP